MYNLIVSRVYKPSSLFSFSLEIRLIAPVIANAVDSSFCWSVALIFFIIYEITILEMRSNKAKDLKKL